MCARKGRSLKRPASDVIIGNLLGVVALSQSCVACDSCMCSWEKRREGKSCLVSVQYICRHTQTINSLPFGPRLGLCLFSFWLHFPPKIEPHLNTQRDICGCFVQYVWSCWVFFSFFSPRELMNWLCANYRLSIGGKHWISWSWWFLDQPVWCSRHPRKVSSPVRTSAAYGTAHPRHCLGKRWISTLTYLRWDTLTPFLRSWFESSLERAQSLISPCIFLYLPGCGACWGCE